MSEGGTMANPADETRRASDAFVAGGTPSADATFLQIRALLAEAAKGLPVDAAPLEPTFLTMSSLDRVRLLVGVEDDLNVMLPDDAYLAPTLQALAKLLPGLVGGACDHATAPSIAGPK